MSKGRPTTSTRTFMTPPEPPKKNPKIKTPKIKAPKLSIAYSKVAWLLVIILAAGCVFLYNQYQIAQDKVQSTKSEQRTQTQDTIKNVSKLVIVPTNETPTIATVTNADKIKDQAFFADAKNGDKVLVYGKQKKAILYRPSTNQIVNINTVTSVQGTNPGN